MKTINDDIINILAYSDVFDYPLTTQEIFEKSTFSILEIEKALHNLLIAKQVFLFHNYYTLRNSPLLVLKRIESNKNAKESLKIARVITKVLSFIPFIRGVFLSGSISKDCMSLNSDLDFFIVTAPKFLWISRSFCVLFKKTILLNSGKYFCFNYIVDENNLKINDENLFTANEIITLIPVFGEDVCKNFFNKNIWIEYYFPNFEVGKKKVKMVSNNLFQYYFEKIFDNKLGDKFDKWLYEKTLAVNKKRHPEKYFQNPNIYYNITRSIAKMHNSDFQEKILNRYNEKLSHYQEKINI
jgi:hypothetical protein